MFKVRFSSDAPIKAKFCCGGVFKPKMSEVIEIPVGETYDGSYEITPTDEVQTLPTQGLISAQNFVINPIPNDYGHISWNGSVITVS